MPWNGSGVFARNYSWVTDVANGIDITASRTDNDTNDIVNNGFGNTLTRDGQGVATNNLPMAGYRHTGVANGQARTDYAALGQDQDSSAKNGGTSSGAGGIFAITLTPAITAYANGQVFTFTTHQAAQGADTLNANGVGAQPIVKGNATAIAINDFASGQELLVMYDTGGGGRFVLLNTPLGALSFINLAITGTISLLSGVGLSGQPLISAGGGPNTWGTITGSGAFVLAVSPAFSGVPTTPTQSMTDNSQQIVNSAWVRSYIGSTTNLALMTVAPSLTFNSPGF